MTDIHLQTSIPYAYGIRYTSNHPSIQPNHSASVSSWEQQKRASILLKVHYYIFLFFLSSRNIMKCLFSFITFRKFHFIYNNSNKKSYTFLQKRYRQTGGQTETHMEREIFHELRGKTNLLYTLRHSFLIFFHFFTFFLLPVVSRKRCSKDYLLH